MTFGTSGANFSDCPESVGSQTTNRNSSRSQHGEYLRRPGPERQIKPRTSTRQRIQSRVSLHPPQEDPRRRKAHLYSASGQHIHPLQAESPDIPNRHRNHLPAAPAIGHIKDPMYRTTTTRLRSTTSDPSKSRNKVNGPRRYRNRFQFSSSVTVIQNRKQHQNPQNH